jgi:hypothetical protein
LQAFAPGHGHLITTPHDEARRLFAHRLKREQRVIDAFAKNNPATLNELVAIVYGDVPQRMHRVGGARCKRICSSWSRKGA